MDPLKARRRFKSQENLLPSGGLSKEMVNPKFNQPQKSQKSQINKKSTLTTQPTKTTATTTTGTTTFFTKGHRGSSNVDNMSVGSKKSRFFSAAGLEAIGSSIIRSSQSLFMGTRKAGKSMAEEFFNANSENKWRAEKSEVIKCDNDQDNHPRHVDWRGFMLSISQNRDPQHKPQGQDCLGVATHKDWEVIVLCDGHDEDGHLVAQGVCATLPHFILRRIFARKTEFSNRPIDEEIITEAFKETEMTVCWLSAHDVEIGDYVKITTGKFKGEIGYVANFLEGDDDEEVAPAKVGKNRPSKESYRSQEEKIRVTVVIDNQILGYNRVELSEDEIRCPRYKGGCTCLAFIRNTVTNRCRVAVMGDSRFMVLGDIGKKFRDEDFIDPVLMLTYVDTEDRKSLMKTMKSSVELTDQVGFFTPQHNVYNASERDRLKAYQQKMQGEFTVNLEDGYLVNPETKMQIQPTRGFGDVEMQGTGYIHIPEISSDFVLAPNSVLIAASDGIFDGEIWEDDEEFLKYVYRCKKEGYDAQKISEMVYHETMQRGFAKHSLDDVSMFVFVVPDGRQNYRKRKGPQERDFKQLSISATASRKMASRRATITGADKPSGRLFKKIFGGANNLGF